MYQKKEPRMSSILMLVMRIDLWGLICMKSIVLMRQIEQSMMQRKYSSKCSDQKYLAHVFKNISNMEV
jgi:hypothetical protein